MHSRSAASHRAGTLSGACVFLWNISRRVRTASRRIDAITHQQQQQHQQLIRRDYYVAGDDATAVRGEVPCDGDRFTPVCMWYCDDRRRHHWSCQQREPAHWSPARPPGVLPHIDTEPSRCDIFVSATFTNIRLHRQLYGSQPNRLARYLNYYINISMTNIGLCLVGSQLPALSWH